MKSDNKLIIRLENKNHEILKWYARLSGKSMNQVINDRIAEIGDNKVKFLENAITASEVLSEDETKELAKNLNKSHKVEKSQAHVK